MTPPTWRFAWSANRYGDPILEVTPPGGQPIACRPPVEAIRRVVLPWLGEDAGAVAELDRVLAAGPDTDGGAR